jgi:hypothetical protein
VFCDQINVLLNVVLGHAYLDAGRGLLPTWAPTLSCTPLPLQFCAKSKNDVGYGWTYAGSFREDIVD